MCQRQKIALGQALRFTRPRWWERAWVLQEAVLAQKKEVSFGVFTVSWPVSKELVLAIMQSSLRDRESLRRAPASTPPDDRHRSLEIPDHQNLQHLVDVIDYIDRLNTAGCVEAQSLVDTLLLTKRSGSTEARDRVYSLLNLVSSEGSATCSVDYSESTQVVFGRVTFASISRLRDCSILGLAKVDAMAQANANVLGSRITRSWIVDYADIRGWPLQSTPRILFGPLRNLSIPGQATLDRPQSLQFIPNTLSLRLTGFCIDKVHSVRTFDTDDLLPVPRISSRYCSWNEPYRFVLRRCYDMIHPPSFRGKLTITASTGRRVSLHGLHSARDGGRQAVHPPGSCRWGKPVGGESLVAFPVAISRRVSLNYVCVHLVMTDGLKRPRKSLRRPNKSWRRLDTVEKTPEWPGV